MMIDARTLPSQCVVETDVCVVGTGPAGLALARELIGQPFRVCVLESGNLEFDEATQALCKGDVVGDQYANLDDLRRRQCGGTSHTWTVQMTPDQIGVRYGHYEQVDFEPRDWLPYSGWPFDLNYLRPYYERAQDVCMSGPFDAYTPQNWETPQTPRLPFDGSRITTTMFQFGPRAAFTTIRRNEVAQADNISLYLNANAVELETDDTAQTVTRVKVACLSGNQFWVSARVVILATGAIESARLLLMSDKTQTNGLGNEHDLVGRYFMDHPLLYTGEFIPRDRNLFNLANLYDLRMVNNTAVMAKLALSEEVIRKEQVMNMSFILFPRYWASRSEAARSVKNVIHALKSGQISGETGRELLKAIAGIGDIAATIYKKFDEKRRPPIPGELPMGGWSAWSNKEKTFRCFEIISQTEQAPDPNNRVVLSRDRDQLGCPKAELHWRWTEMDYSHARRGQEILVQEVERMGLGKVLLDHQDGKPKLFHPTSHHHMGTTRMHVDPTQGVVDENCKVHSVSNLFIASSSVFPTGSYANPTLTIVALAVRLADHVKQTLLLRDRVTVG